MLISPDGPFWSPDPTLGATMGAELAEAVTGPTPLPANVNVTSPLLPLPGLTPDILDPEFNVKGWVFALPWVYLPADVWMRQPGERRAAWLLRVTYALMLADLIAPGDDGMWRPARIMNIEISDRTLPQLAAWGMNRVEYRPADAIRNLIASRLKEAQLDGRAFMIDWAASLTDQMERGVPVIQAWNTLEFLHTGDIANAGRLRNGLGASYPWLFDDNPQPTEQQLQRLVADHEADARTLLERLAANGMETRETLDDWGHRNEQ